MSQYTTGNVTLVSGSATVVGGSCDFLTASNVKIGDLFKKSGENAWYTVSAVNSATNLSITPAYAQSNASNTDYIISRDFTPNFNLAEMSAGDLDFQDAYTRSMRIIDNQINAYSVQRGEVYSITSGSGRFGWAVGLTSTPNTVTIANASRGSSAIPAIGVIASDMGTTVNVYYRGPVASNWGSRISDANRIYYLKAWAGTATNNITATIPTTASHLVQRLGKSKSATSLLVDIDQSYVEI